MALFEFKVTGLNAVVNKFASLRKRFGDMTPALKTGATYLFGSVQRNFRAQGRPKKWKGLSSLTLFIRAHRVGPKNEQARILEDTGRLKGSIFPVHDSKDGTFGVSAAAPGARLAQFGGRTESRTVAIDGFTRKNRSGVGEHRVRPYLLSLAGGATVPARPFFLIQSEDEPRLRRIFSDFIEGA